VEDFDSPPHTISNDDLSGAGVQITASQVLYSTAGSFYKLRTNQLDVAHMAQVAFDLSDAKFHSLFFRSIRQDTNRLPLDAAVIFKKLSHLRPSFEFWRAQVMSCGFNAPGFV
jgi:hypothetical protein